MHPSQIATLIGADLYRDGPEIDSLAPLIDAREGQLSVLSDPRYERYLKTTRASAVILSRPRTELMIAQIIHDDPMGAFISLLHHFHPVRRPVPGVREGAIVSQDAVLEDGVVVEAGAIIEAGARVGTRAVIGAGCYVGAWVTVGKESVLYPRVVLLASATLGRRVMVQAGTVIGSDGFGYRWNGHAHRKIPQVGSVIIEDDVEIGANCTIDRAMVGQTVIGMGTKIDNLVHIGHNVRIGERCLIIAQVGISGSVRIGQGVTLAGQVGVADHAVIGDGVTVVAQSGVHGTVAAGELIAGTPHIPHAAWRRVAAALPRLPALLRTVRRLEKALASEKEQGS